MPNQSNFRSDVTTPTEPRFLASRIVSFPEEDILSEQIPASFGFELVDNIEVHFYTVPDNTLLLSLVVRTDEDDVLKSHIVTYADESFRNYLRIDFTRLFEKNNVILLPGDYKIVMNFFSDEIGSYTDRRLFIDEISESRTEVQLQFFSTNNLVERQENIRDLKEFVEPSFPKPVAIGVAEKIFRSGVTLNDENEGITYSGILNNFEIPQTTQTIENTIERIRRLSPDAETLVESSINQFLLYLYDRIREEIVLMGDRRIQEDEFNDFIETVVDRELNYLQSTIDSRIVVA